MRLVCETNVRWYYSILLLVCVVGWKCCCYCCDGLSSPHRKTTKNVATRVLQATGSPLVDTNQYNLPSDRIETEWCANFVQKIGESENGEQI